MSVDTDCLFARETCMQIGVHHHITCLQQSDNRSHHFLRPLAEEDRLRNKRHLFFFTAEGTWGS